MSGPAMLEMPKTAPNRPGPLAALAGRHDVADRRLGGDHQAAAAEPLDRPEGDELRHALREPAEHGPDEEDHERSLQHDLAPVEVAELAVERRHDRHREQVRGDDPRQVLEAAELADDRRQRGRHDRLVERRQQHHEHQPADDEEHRPAVGRPVGDRVGHGAHGNESYCSGWPSAVSRRSPGPPARPACPRRSLRRWSSDGGRPRLDRDLRRALRAGRYSPRPRSSGAPATGRAPRAGRPRAGRRWTNATDGPVGPSRR